MRRPRVPLPEFPTFPLYSYNLAGSLTSETLPSGRILNMTYDAANRPTTIQVTMGTAVTNYIGNPSVPYATADFQNSIQYAPHGGVWAYTRGDKIIRAEEYNSRLQSIESYYSLQNVNSPSAMLFVSCPHWGSGKASSAFTIYPICPSGPTMGDNGNLVAYAEYLGAPGASSYTIFSQSSIQYDGVNRLMNISDSGAWSRSFAYDQWGNMSVSAATGNTPLNVNTPQASNPSSIFNANNQRTDAGQGYDAAGNVTAMNLFSNLTYDAENRLLTSSAPTPFTYAYDGEGRRVTKTGAGNTTVYVYDAAGRLAAEYSTAADTPNCITCYLSTDHLGTTRLITDQNGYVVSRHDYLPFGEEIMAGSAGRSASLGFDNPDNVNQKFTGKERDQESGLDYFGARYYGSALGRWTSPDAVNLTDERSMSPTNTLNKYIYGGNNPLKYIDQDGRDITVFYQPGFPTGHFALAAFNQNTNDFAYLSVGPQQHLDPNIPLHPFDGVPGTTVFEIPKTADEARERFASLTIQTLPEVAQQAIDAIRNGAGTGNWAMLGNQCSSSCAKVLRDIGLLDPDASLVLPWNPHTLWNTLLLNYGKNLSRSERYNLFYNPGSLRKTNTGQEYGNSRYGMKTYDWLMLMLKAPLKACVSVSDSASGSKFGGCQ